MINRADYYTADTWGQINPWVQQYQIQPVRPVVETALRTANAAERVLFGFKDPNATADVWFYDYYTYSPSYYTYSENTATDYSGAVRYYDSNNDGVYETYGRYRDSDHDGRFDEFDRYDFSTVETKDDFDNSPRDSKRHTVTGTIEATKKTQVNKVVSLAARVKQKDDSIVIVDLGPDKAFSNVGIEASIAITATGYMERIGEMNIFMAETATISEKDIRIQRALPSFSGTVKEVKQIKIDDAPHSMVVIETQSGNQLVDLGPVDALKITVAPQSQIVVYGVPVQSHDHQVVMASRIDLDGKTHSITRWK